MSRTYSAHFIKNPSPLLIQVSYSSLQVLPVLFCSLFRRQQPATVWHAQTTTHTNGSLMRCLTMKTSWHWRSVGKWPQWILSLIYEYIKCFNVRRPLCLLGSKVVNQINTIVSAHTHAHMACGSSRTRPVPKCCKSRHSNNFILINIVTSYLMCYLQWLVIHLWANSKIFVFEVSKRSQLALCIQQSINFINHFI